MEYAYDMLGNRIHQFSMEAGARWMWCERKAGAGSGKNMRHK